jgi:putative membrane protein
MAWRANGLLFLLILPWIAWSAWRPYDRLTWWLEVTPVFIGFIALALAARKGWRFSSFVMLWLGLHMVLLLVGGHYTYALTPVGERMKGWLGAERNHYDRLGHLFQGIVPALACREILLRNQVFARRGWLHFTVISFCLAFSACYELVEWAAALLSAEAAESFLGTQGDHWDTQTDMFLAGVGSLVTLFLLRPLHDRSMARLRGESSHSTET